MSVKSLRLLVDIGHPAHVHLFRNAIRIWLERGHSLAITIRDKDLTAELLSLYGFQFSVASKARNGSFGLAVELLEHNWGVLNSALRHRSQILLGTSVSITHVARLIGAKSIVFSEDDADVARTFVRLTYPYAHTIVTPTCLNEDHGRKHVTYRGYQKLAYLHPNQFTPDHSVLDKMGVKRGEPYFVIRLVSLQAAHDAGESGIKISTLGRLLQVLTKKGKVFITSEKPLLPEFDHYRISIPVTDIHHALFYATLFIGDSQSMALEAAVLGTPAIRFNTFAKRCSALLELEHQYGLTFGFQPVEEDRMLAKVDELLNTNNLRGCWQEKRKVMLSDMIDVTPWMVNFVENYPSSLYKYQRNKHGSKTIIY